MTHRSPLTRLCLLGLALSGCADGPRPDGLALDAGFVDTPGAAFDAPAAVDAPVAANPRDRNDW